PPCLCQVAVPASILGHLHSFWVMNYVAFNGDACCDLATDFMALAEKQSAPVPLMVGHHLMGVSLAFTGALVDAQAHFNQTITLDDPAVQRAQAMRFGQDVGVAILPRRSFALWTLGYPDAAMADIAQARRDAREISQAATSMYVLGTTSEVSLYCGDYAAAT